VISNGQIVEITAALGRKQWELADDRIDGPVVLARFPAAPD